MQATKNSCEYDIRMRHQIYNVPLFLLCMNICDCDVYMRTRLPHISPQKKRKRLLYIYNCFFLYINILNYAFTVSNESKTNKKCSRI